MPKITSTTIADQNIAIDLTNTEPVYDTEYVKADLTKPATMIYGDFLLALSDDEYVEAVNTTEVGCSLYSGVVQYAKVHYPHITLE